jgi:hypothetical protein
VSSLCEQSSVDGRQSFPYYPTIVPNPTDGLPFAPGKWPFFFLLRGLRQKVVLFLIGIFLGDGNPLFDHLTQPVNL